MTDRGRTALSGGLKGYLVDSVVTEVVGGASDATATAVALVNSDRGKTFIVTGGYVAFTLPAIAGTGVPGNLYTIATSAKAGKADIKITPDTGENIRWITLVADKDLELRVGDQQPGDYVTLVADDAASWKPTAIAGTWRKEP
jgi:hypothetical protein